MNPNKDGHNILGTWVVVNDFTKIMFEARAPFNKIVGNFTTVEGGASVGENMILEDFHARLHANSAIIKNKSFTSLFQNLNIFHANQFPFIDLKLLHIPHNPFTGEIIVPVEVTLLNITRVIDCEVHIEKLEEDRILFRFECVLNRKYFNFTIPQLNSILGEEIKVFGDVVIKKI